jgi:hypothetical protein
MFLIAAAAIAASPPSAPPRMMSVGASVQAIATIRVISGVRLSFDEKQSDANVPRVRETLVRNGGLQQPARLIEFQ